ncbi:MAG: KEOPS complex subunit Pcc1 [Acidilobus sp.]
MEALAEVELCLGQLVSPLLAALKAEASQPAQPSKGSVAVNLEGGCLRLTLEAKDVGDLRALLNSYLYLIHAAYSSLVRLDQGSASTQGRQATT